MNEPNIKVELELSLDTVVTQRYVGPGDEDGPDLEPVTLYEVVAQQMVQAFLGQLDAEAVKDLNTRARNAADELIKERVAAMVSEALDQVVPTITLGGGNLNGKTLHEYVVDVAKRELTTKHHTSSGYRQNETLLDRIIREHVEHAFQAQLVTEINSAKVAAREVVTMKAAEVIAETITRSRASG